LSTGIHEVPKIPSRTTQPKSKLTKPEDERRRRSVSLKASSSKQRPDEQEESGDEFWRERESREASDRFGKRPRTRIYDDSPKEKPKQTKTKRSRSRQERRESPESVKLDCDDECKVQVRNDRGKWKECGRLCHRTDVHGLKDCECNNHIRERQLEEARREMRFKVPQENVTEDENERYLAEKEERVLKMVHDISERKREDSRRLTEKWIQQELELAKKERNRGTRERSDSESSRDDPRKGKEKERPRINMIRATPSKEVVLVAGKRESYEQRSSR
jgi:hypothetical protein